MNPTSESVDRDSDGSHQSMYLRELKSSQYSTKSKFDDKIREFHEYVVILQGLFTDNGRRKNIKISAEQH
jgi:hypothetical protein